MPDLIVLLSRVCLLVAQAYLGLAMMRDIKAIFAALHVGELALKTAWQARTAANKRRMRELMGLDSVAVGP